VKIVATSDTHFAFGVLPEGDVLIHAGDALYSGNAGEWNKFVESMSRQPHKEKLYVPGNHDFYPYYYEGPAKAELRSAGVWNLYPKSYTLRNGWRVIGCPFTSGLHGWAYPQDDQQKIYDYLKSHGRADIVVSHAPPAGVLDRGAHAHGGHYGLQALRKYIVEYQPAIVICGHVHEGYGHQKVDRTDVYNVCMCDLDYKQSNKPIIIEIPD
jgi:Icc-related predicted phosphoesterase